jgi:hypothetical protein
LVSKFGDALHRGEADLPVEVEGHLSQVPICLPSRQGMPGWRARRRAQGRRWRRVEQRQRNDPGRSLQLMVLAVPGFTFASTRRPRIAVRIWQHGNVLPGPAGGTGRRSHLRSDWPKGRTGGAAAAVAASLCFATNPVPGTGRVSRRPVLISAPEHLILMALRRWLQRRARAFAPGPPFCVSGPESGAATPAESPSARYSNVSS